MQTKTTYGYVAVYKELSEDGKLQYLTRLNYITPDISEARISSTAEKAFKRSDILGRIIHKEGFEIHEATKVVIIGERVDVENS